MSSGNLKNEIPLWWSRRRWRYNRGLMISVLIATTLYFILGKEMTDGFEITVRSVFSKLGFGIVLILLANIFYVMCAMIDTRLNWGGMERVSQIAWNVVYWSSVAVPFVMPLLILADRYDLYSALGL